MKADSIEIIGEIGTNHNGKLETALELIDMASEVGIHTVKIQIYDAMDIVSPLVETKFYGIDNNYKYWRDYIDNVLITPKEWVPHLVSYSKEKKINIFAAVHSLKNAEICLKHGIKRLKIASMDCNNFYLIKEISSLKTPLIISTGMATRDEIIKAYETAVTSGCEDLTFFHCVSTYPTKYEEVNLEFIKFLKHINDKVGLSDHSEDNLIALMSLTYGIIAIEKHITLDKKSIGPDHPFALDKNGLIDLKQKIENGIKALGSTNKKMSAREILNRKIYRRYPIALRNINKGEKLSKNDYTFARPEGIFDDIIPMDAIEFFEGIEIKRNIQTGQALRLRFFK